jgi:uncharacterized protein (TIGR03435 family)
MKTKVESRNMRSGWKTVSSLAGCVALAVAFAMGPQVNRAAAQSPAPAAQTAAPAATAQPATPASPTDLAGIWQGTLTPPNAPKGIRFVIKITKGSDGSYKAALFNADRGSPPLHFATATLQGGDVKLTSPQVSIAGKMSADGKTIDGNFVAGGPNPLPISLARTMPDAAWPIPEMPKPMAADANPGFDVATIKPGKPGALGKNIGFDGQKFIARNLDTNDLIAFAYGLHTKQIIGAPEWFATDLYDIAGTPDVEGQPSLHQMELMMQKLLPDRFALKFHHEQRELPVYIITVAPGGPKMTKTKAGPNDPQPFFFRGLGDLVVGNMSITEFATWMQSSVMDKPVVDHTGLTDKYDFTLKWTPDDSQFAQFRGTNPQQPPAAGDNPNAPPSLYTAMPEQLGLKIEAGKAMDDVIVIDHVEKPSPN